MCLNALTCGDTWASSLESVKCLSVWRYVAAAIVTTFVDMIQGIQASNVADYQQVTVHAEMD